MRLAVAFGAMLQGIFALGQPYPYLVRWSCCGLGVVICISFLIGFLTPIAGASGALANAFLGVVALLNSAAATHDNALTAFAMAVISLSLVMLGPGAYSLDARLFGHREIIIPELPRRPNT